MALPIFREIMLRIYQDQLQGPAPQFPRKIEKGIDEYLKMRATLDSDREDRRAELPRASRRRSR